ncbi:MAG: heavy metal translocating P-type ATPase [Proteobacteria bacterium]|nr:heavy metal translocating P-type ATPase [Pseudomonadota bacterium]MBU1688530.1 heavy metal translocating P-type ATPase [Pseudomonadota bacterium]
MMNLPETCIHCTLPIPPSARVIDRVDDEELHFCCQGCRGAYLIITGAGLDSFYTKRSWETPGIPENAFETIYNDEYLGAFTTTKENSREISIIVSGIRCSACIWLIESILAKRPGIIEAVINYGTHRGRIRFDPDQTSPSQIFTAISRLGYVPRPFTQDGARLLQEKESRSLLIRFGTAAFLSMQLMGYTLALYGGYFSGMDAETRQLLQYLAALVATPVVFYSGAPFLRGAFRSIVNKAPNMDLLIALGVLAAYLYSLGAMLVGREVFFETSAMIISLILLGRIFENSARKAAYSGIDKLLRLTPDTTLLLRGAETIVVTSDQLQVGDTILVGPGDRLPVDGVLLDQETEVDESVLTGEAEPVLKRFNDTLLSGSMNVSTSVRVRVSQPAGSSFMARITRMIEEAQSRKAPVQGLADRVAGTFIPAVIIMALATAGYWSLHSDNLVLPLLHGISVLVVACPCALGLATPTAILVATGVSARHGMLFRGGDTLEAAARLTVAGFDKTGTLTESFPEVISISTIDITPQTLLALAARAEAGSSHPLARGILAKAHQEGIRISAGGGTIIAGKGVRLTTDETTLLAGSRLFMEENAISLPKNLEPTALTEVFIAENGRHRGCIYLDSQLREGARATVAKISSLGLSTMLLTGDHLRSAEKVAALTGIDQYRANMTPADKTSWVQQLRAEQEVVLMVGDGVNDAPALSAASVGCAMGGGTDIALEISDLVLMHNDLTLLPEAIRLARQTLTIIRQNLFWAFTYNLVAIPLAASGHLAPVYAAAAMAASSVCVVANSLRLKGFRPEKSERLAPTNTAHLSERHV